MLFSGVTPSLVRMHSDEQTRPGSEPLPFAHGENSVSLYVWNLTFGLSGMSGSTA